MPRYNDGDSENPDDISWFEDNPYDDGDSENPDTFSCFEDTPASAADEEGYHVTLQLKKLGKVIAT
jgi:hypothetical protein